MPKYKLAISGFGAHKVLGQTVHDVIKDMLRYDKGELISEVLEEKGHFTAVVFSERYTPDRWNSFMIHTRVMDDEELTTLYT